MDVRAQVLGLVAVGKVRAHDAVDVSGAKVTAVAPCGGHMVPYPCPRYRIIYNIPVKVAMEKEPQVIVFTNEFYSWSS